MIFTYKINIIGKENIPNEGKCILAGNHTKWLDPIMLISTVKRQVHFLAKEELFSGPTKFIMHGIASIPVNRKIHDKEALSSSYQALESGQVIGIFPEGTINRTKEVTMPFKIGAVKMAQKTGSYLVPFAITGTYKIFRKSIKLTFLPPYKVENTLSEENELLRNKISNILIKENKDD